MTTGTRRSARMREYTCPINQGSTLKRYFMIDPATPPGAPETGSTDVPRNTARPSRTRPFTIFFAARHLAE